MSSRLKIALVLAAFELVSSVALKYTPRNELYFLVAGSFSLLVLPAISRIGSDLLVIDILKLSLLMLISQAVGLAGYHLRIPVSVYNYCVFYILIFQFIRLLITRRGDGVSKNNNFVHLLCSFNFKGGI